VAAAQGAAPSMLGAFWKFLRPHTIRGTVLGTSAVRARRAGADTRSRLDVPRCAQVVIRALSANPELVDFALVPRALLGLLALLCGNGYIVGINQARRSAAQRERSWPRLTCARWRSRLHALRGGARSTTSASTK
jgi:hypothetical protein